MINRARKGAYKSLTLYISNDNQELKQVSELFAKDMVYTVEIECNFFRRFLNLNMIVNDNLIKHTIGKEIDRLNEKNIFRIILIDVYNYKIDRTFICHNASKITSQSDKSGDSYVLELIDIYGYYFSEPSFITHAQSYTGTPMIILQNILTDAMKLPDEILRSYGIPVIQLKIESSPMYFLGESKEITMKVTQEHDVFWYVHQICSLNYIFSFQDFESFCIIENPDFSKMTSSFSSDGSSLWSEFAPDNYDFLVDEKRKQQASENIIDCPEITISLNSQGKSQETQTLNVRDVVGVFELNNNADETADLFETRKITESSGSSGIKSIMYDYTKKYMKMNNLVIYVSGPVFKCLPGMVTSVEIRPRSGHVPDMYKGDYRYSGNWLIRSCTVKTVGPLEFYIRLILCRFDNPKSPESSLSESGSEDHSDTSYATSKPNIPKISRSFDALGKIADDVRELTNKVKSFQSQIRGYQNYASQKIDALTSPIKTQFVNDVKSSEVYKNVSEFTSKNRRTLNLVNDVLRERTGVNLMTGVSIVNEIMNIDSVIKDATIGQIEHVISDVTSRIDQTVTSTTNAVNSVVSNAITVRNNIDEMCSNIEDAELNLDSGLETAESILKTISDTKHRIDSVKRNVKNLKTSVQNIPDTVKIENPLDILKKKRNQILSRVRPIKS